MLLKPHAVVMCILCLLVQTVWQTVNESFQLEKWLTGCKRSQQVISLSLLVQVSVMCVERGVEFRESDTKRVSF